MRFLLVLIAVLITLAYGTADAVQEAPPPGFQEKTDAIRNRVKPGEVMENIASAFDPRQSYAVYLPSAYAANQTWPALFLMDPRGRARVPLDRYAEVAERYGYILVSSYNTASDTDQEVNTPALRAMLADTTYMFSIDRKRLYLSGFSGTARVAWILAAQLEQHIAGIIGFGGGWPGDFRPSKETPYGYYGASGRTDFNYEEMRSLDHDLDRLEIAHRFEYFDGTHQWGPAEVCTRAVEWMELRAMKTGLRAKNEGDIAEIYQRRFSEAEASEDAYETYVRYQAIVEDFGGLVESTRLDGAAAKVKALEKLEEVRETVELQERMASRHRRYVEQYTRLLHRLENEDRLWRLNTLVRELQLSQLKRQAEDRSKPRRADAAQRILELVYVDMAFYLPGQYLDRNNPARAITMLQVADFIRPGDFRTLISFARAYAKKGDKGKAIESLHRANEIRPLDRDFLARDPYFDSIRSEPEFQALIQRLLQ